VSGHTPARQHSAGAHPAWQHIRRGSASGAAAHPARQHSRRSSTAGAASGRRGRGAA